jgi:hypothetical protein
MNKIKVSRNVAFNENVVPVNIEDLPGVPAEGEIGTNPTSTPVPETSKPQDTQTLVEPEMRNLQARTKVDYKQLNNPSIRPPTQQPSKLTI